MVLKKYQAAGITVDNDNTDESAEKILNFYYNESQMKNRISALKKTASQYFDIENYLDVYSTALKKIF